MALFDKKDKDKKPPAADDVGGAATGGADGADGAGADASASADGANANAGTVKPAAPLAAKPLPRIIKLLRGEVHHLREDGEQIIHKAGAILKEGEHLATVDIAALLRSGAAKLHDPAADKAAADAVRLAALRATQPTVASEGQITTTKTGD